MKPSERERCHQARLEQINQVQLLAGCGDRSQVDHEGTLLERARMFEEEIASHAATERGIAAFDRLLRVVQERGSPQAVDVAAFLRAVREGKALPLAALRVADRSVSDDMLAVLDAHRYARFNLVEHVEGGPRRVAKILKACEPA
ncbi:MAG: hypothetical protein HY854_10290 [Burkholderiales bacterium]|nr:hypothetical protein [Burkholderiales bacterium]